MKVRFNQEVELQLFLFEYGTDNVLDSCYERFYCGDELDVEIIKNNPYKPDCTIKFETDALAFDVKKEWFDVITDEEE